MTEFKKITLKNEIRYVLESASSGATGASAVASSTVAVDNVQRRSNILAQEGDKILVPVTQKPRQGPLRPQTGGGAHRDKKKEQKQGKEKHRKPFAEDDVSEELKKRNPTRDHLRRYPVPQDQMVRPVKKKEEKKKPEQGVAEGSPQSLGTALANALSRAEPGSKLDKKIRHHNDMVRRFGPEAGIMTSAPDGYHIDKKGFVRLGQGVAEGEKKPYPKTWHDVDPKLGKQVDKMSQAEKVKKGYAHPDTLKNKGVAEDSDYMTDNMVSHITQIITHLDQQGGGSGDRNTFMKLVARKMPRIVQDNPKLFRRAFGIAYDRYFHIDQDDDDFDYTDYSMRKGERGVAEADLSRRGFLGTLGKAGLAAAGIGLAGKAQARVSPGPDGKVNDKDDRGFGGGRSNNNDLGNGFVLTTIDVAGYTLKAVLDTQTKTHYTLNRRPEGGGAIIRNMAPFIVIKDGQIKMAMNVGPETLEAMKKAGLETTNEDMTEGSEFGAYYSEQVAQEIFNKRQDITSEDEVLNQAYHIVSNDKGQRSARYMFNYDADFSSDVVSNYFYLQKQQGVDETNIGKQTGNAVNQIGNAAAKGEFGSSSSAAQFDPNRAVMQDDHEISMASNELKSITADAMKLLMLIKKYSEMDGLEAWQQSKITKAADYLNSVLQSIGGEQSTLEGLRNPKDNPCWKGYKPVGTKQKGGRTVPNCVPKESVDSDHEEWYDKNGRPDPNGAYDAGGHYHLERDVNDKYMESLTTSLLSILGEKAPPGEKYERMVKHIKKGYSDDGKLTDVEKRKAYGAAWKAKNKAKK